MLEESNMFNPSKGVLMGKDKLLKIFYDLNERLKENQLKLDLTIYGGTVMNFLYDNRPATRDIDCLISDTDTKLLRGILDDIQFTHSLDDDWINDEIKGPLECLLKEDLSIFKSYSNLSVITPSKEQLLAMKVLSARSEPSKDFIDAYLLCKDLGVTTKNQLLDIFRDYLPVKLLRERQIQFIKYLGKDLGYDW